MACHRICAECSNSVTDLLATKIMPNGLSRNLSGMREFRDRPSDHKIEAEWPVTEYVRMREFRDRPIGNKIEAELPVAVLAFEKSLFDSFSACHSIEQQSCRCEQNHAICHQYYDSSLPCGALYGERASTHFQPIPQPAQINILVYTTHARSYVKL